MPVRERGCLTCRAWLRALLSLAREVAENGFVTQEDQHLETFVNH
jgi:hypothetical protein